MNLASSRADLIVLLKNGDVHPWDPIDCQTISSLINDWADPYLLMNLEFFVLIILVLTSFDFVPDFCGFEANNNLSINSSFWLESIKAAFRLSFSGEELGFIKS